MKLTHQDASGRARMVDVGAKPVTERSAEAEGSITLPPEAYALVEEHAGPKGDALRTAELAGTMGAKRTSDLIPLCHPIGLEFVEVHCTLDPALPGVRVRARAKAVARTGVEMEALTAVSVALLTIYDMVKSASHELEIGDVRLIEKSGGATGYWRRPT
jgi:cyclic pyranopterin phosphate synthase